MSENVPTPSMSEQFKEQFKAFKNAAEVLVIANPGVLDQIPKTTGAFNYTATTSIAVSAPELKSLIDKFNRAARFTDNMDLSKQKLDDHNQFREKVLSALSGVKDSTKKAVSDLFAEQEKSIAGYSEKPYLDMLAEFEKLIARFKDAMKTDPNIKRSELLIVKPSYALNSLLPPKDREWQKHNIDRPRLEKLEEEVLSFYRLLDRDPQILEKKDPKIIAINAPANIKPQKDAPSLQNAG